MGIWAFIIRDIVGGPLFSGLEVTGVTIWYQSGVPFRPRPGMAIRGFGFVRFKKKV